MIKVYKPAFTEIITEYSLVFDDGHHNGFSFPCDENGKLPENMKYEKPAAFDNYIDCLKHPERFLRFNKVVKEERSVRNCASGVCSCGERVYLYDQHCGACQCPNCGKWYNLFGQELISPEEWND